MCHSESQSGRSLSMTGLANRKKMKSYFPKLILVIIMIMMGITWVVFGKHWLYTQACQNTYYRMIASYSHSGVSSIITGLPSLLRPCARLSLVNSRKSIFSLWTISTFHHKLQEKENYKLIFGWKYISSSKIPCTYLFCTRVFNSD